MSPARRARERPPGPVLLSNPDSYRSRPLVGMPPVIWLMVAVAVSVVGAGITLTESLRDAPEPGAAEQTVEVVRLSPYIGGFYDQDGVARTIRVSTRPGGYRQPDARLPIWADVQAAVDANGSVTHAWYQRDRPDRPPGWVLSLTGLASLAGVAGAIAISLRPRRSRRGAAGRVEANIALLLDRHNRKLPADPDAKIAAVLGDENLAPRAAPWVPEGTGGGTGDAVTLRAGWYPWLLPATVTVAAAIISAASVQAVSGDRQSAIYLAFVLTGASIAAAAAVPATLRITVAPDGTLTRQTLLGRKRFPLSDLDQLVGWSWSTNKSGGRTHMAPGSLWLRSRAGDSMLLPLSSVARSERLAPPLRAWALAEGAAVTGDLAYTLGLTTDPRDEPPAPLRTPDLSWLDTPARVRVGRSTRPTAVAFAVFALMLVPAASTWFVAEGLSDTSGPPRGLLIDVCAPLAAAGFTEVEVLEPEPGLFTGCAAQTDRGPLTVWGSPSTLVYVEVLAGANNRGGSYAPIDAGWLELHEAVQGHVIVGPDDRVSVAVMTRSGMVRVFDTHVSEEMLEVAAAAVEELNRRPIGTEHRVVETTSTVRSPIGQVPDSPDPDPAERQITGTPLAGAR